MICGSPPKGIVRWSVRLIASGEVMRKLAPQMGWESIRIMLQSYELKPRR